MTWEGCYCRFYECLALAFIEMTIFLASFYSFSLWKTRSYEESVQGVNAAVIGYFGERKTKEHGKGREHTLHFTHYLL